MTIGQKTFPLSPLLWAIMSDEAKKDCIEDFRRVLNGLPRAVDYEDPVPMPKAFYDADAIRGHALGVVIEPEIGPKLGRKAKRPL